MKNTLVALLSLAALAISLPLVAGHLGAPNLLSVNVNTTDGELEVAWDDLAGAVKYSVNVIADYDTDGDTIPDCSQDFDFGTGDRTDGAPFSQPDLDIPLAAFDNVDCNGDLSADTPISGMVRVKGLDPGKSKGRQNHPFSNLIGFVFP